MEEAFGEERASLAGHLEVLRQVESTDSNVFRIVELEFRIEHCKNMIAIKQRFGIPSKKSE
jgi:hypothetical protein